MFFDSHAHYDDEQFDQDRDELLGAMTKNGVSYIINAGSCIDSGRKSLELAQKYDFIYATVGIHPHEVSNLTEDDMVTLKELASDKKVVAIGEIGLDYYYDNSPRDKQRQWFARQIELASELGLPVVIHDRDAHGDCLEILKSENIAKIGGVMHCYSGSVEMAKQVLDLGMYISVGGPVTFKNAVRPVEVAKYVPLDRLLIETDSPYLAPVPQRGKRNCSIYIKYIAEKIAALRGISIEEVAEKTRDNAMRLFGISDN